MRKFTTCFVGIPLPERYQEDFENLLRRISEIDPNLQIAFKETPHITAYYLDEKSPDSLPEIEKVVREQTKILRNCQIKAGGMGTFGKDSPKILFLDIDYPAELAEFNKALSIELSAFTAFDNELPFHPHMTVASIKTEGARKSWKSFKNLIEEELSKIKWEFEVTEVAIYGVDSTKIPEYQEKLISVLV